MKIKTTKLCIIMLIFTAPLQFFSQDPNYSGPAKTNVKSFWSLVEKVKAAGSASSIQLQNLEKGVKITKEKDPSYNTAEMEAELKVWKEKGPAKSKIEISQEQQYQKQKSQMAEGMDKMNGEQLLLKVIDGTNMEVGSNNLPYVQKAMDDYKSDCDKALAMDLTKHTAYLEKLKMYVDRSAVTAVNKAISRAQGLIKEVTKSEEFEPAYQELRFRQLHWDLLRKVYSSDPNCEKKYQEVVATLNQLGGKDAIEKAASKNNADKIKNNKMDPPAVKDAVLEKFVMDAFNATFKNDYGTCIKVVLTQNGWTTERNPITSVITGRNRTTQVAYKASNGKCYLLSGIVFIYEEYNGSTYTNRIIVYKGLGGYEMLCENVK